MYNLFDIPYVIGKILKDYVLYGFDKRNAILLEISMLRPYSSCFSMSWVCRLRKNVLETQCSGFIDSVSRWRDFLSLNLNVAVFWVLQC